VVTLLNADLNGGFNILVSIPQSGFLVVTRAVESPGAVYRKSFNPSVGILGGHTRHTRLSSQGRKLCFNPSVGILGGHTPELMFQGICPENVSIPQSGFLVVTPSANASFEGIQKLFQSLSRDSWWSHLVLRFERQGMARVSIPQSGFLVVTRFCLTSMPMRLKCFNPSVGILGGHTSGHPC
jgi:hypothetical protein